MRKITPMSDEQFRKLIQQNPKDWNFQELGIGVEPYGSGIGVSEEQLRQIIRQNPDMNTFWCTKYLGVGENRNRKVREWLAYNEGLVSGVGRQRTNMHRLAHDGKAYREKSPVEQDQPKRLTDEQLRQLIRENPNVAGFNHRLKQQGISEARIVKARRWLAENESLVTGEGSQRTKVSRWVPRPPKR